MHFIHMAFNPAVVGILALFLAVLWMLRKPKDKTRPLLVFALVINLFYGLLLTIFMSREGGLFPWKFDHVLFHMDESLGIRAISITQHLQGKWHVPLWIVYQLMIPMMIVWFLVTQYGRARGNIVMAYIAEMVTGPVLYALLPACGPAYAFGPNWLQTPSVPADTMRLAGMPNAFPSLHIGTAFVFVFFAPGKLWKVVALLFLAGTFLGTLSTGEHYVIDLVPGLAFGVFAAYVGLRAYRRAFAYLALVLGWSLAVRFGSSTLIAHPLLTRSFAVATVVLVAHALWVQWRASSPAADLYPAQEFTV